MNWRERIKPSNAAEAGCLVLLVAIPLAFAAIFWNFNYLPYIATALWLIFYAFRFGYQAYVAYEVSKRTAFIISGMLVLVYFLLWLGTAVLINWGFQNFIGQTNLGLIVIFGILLAIAMYFHLIRYRQTVYEKWLGWQRKEGLADG